MLNFQEQLKKDLDNVFFNVGAMEFVTPVKIQGVRGLSSTAHTLNVVIDNERYNERRLRSQSSNIVKHGFLFFVKKDEWLKAFNRLPSVDNVVDFNDVEDLIVRSVVEVMGTLEITLESNIGVESGWQ